MNMPSDQQVEDYIASVPNLRDEWGIPNAKRIATLTFVLMNMLLIAIIIGFIAYLMLVDPRISAKGISGLIIILVLAYASIVVRLFQLRAERRELPSFQRTLAKELTGDPEKDTAIQEHIDESFKWDSMKFQYIARMIGIAGLIIIALNTYQIGGTDFARILLFDGAILAYLVGALWANYAFKKDILEVTLLERCRATIAWQHDHHQEPGAKANSDR